MNEAEYKRFFMRGVELITEAVDGKSRAALISTLDGVLCATMAALANELGDERMRQRIAERLEWVKEVEALMAMPNESGFNVH